MTCTAWAPRVAAAAVAATVASTLGPAAAWAETRRFSDPNESGTAADTGAVTVVHTSGPNGPGGRLVVRVRAGTVDYGDFFDLWIDTPRARRNFFARIRPETEYGPVKKVRAWSVTGPAACSNWEARSVAGPDEVVIFSIPRACLGNPGRVRVAERSSYEQDDSTFRRDWVPAARTFTPWVRATRP